MANETDKNESRIIGEIEEAPNFDKLYEIIKNKETIAGFKYNFNADFLVDKINQIREELKDSQKEGDIKDLNPEAIKRFMVMENMTIKELILYITRKDGLRAKVIELAIDEVIERKGR